MKLKKRNILFSIALFVVEKILMCTFALLGSLIVVSLLFISGLFIAKLWEIGFPQYNEYINNAGFAEKALLVGLTASIFGKLYNTSYAIIEKYVSDIQSITFVGSLLKHPENKNFIFNRFNLGSVLSIHRESYLPNNFRVEYKPRNVCNNFYIDKRSSIISHEYTKENLIGFIAVKVLNGRLKDITSEFNVSIKSCSEGSYLNKLTGEYINFIRLSSKSMLLDVSLTKDNFIVYKEYVLVYTGSHLNYSERS